MKLFYIILLYIFSPSVIVENTIFAQLPPVHGEHNHSLHFSHPLVAESPSPDTKVRANYNYVNSVKDNPDVHTIILETEYAFFRWLSLEVDIPYTFLSKEMITSRLDNIGLSVKYANYVLEENGLLLGGGMEFGLPTGNDETGIGSNTVWDVEPFLDFGYKNNRIESVGFAKFGFPVNGDKDEADFEFSWNLSFLYQFIGTIEGLVEFSGKRISGGEEDGFGTVLIIPGIKVRPIQSTNFKIGFGYSLPLTDEKEINNGSVLSLFYHF